MMRPIAETSRTSTELAQFLSVESSTAFIFTGLTTSTKFVEQGDLFVALPGLKVHGATFAGEAESKGAVAILTDKVGAQIQPSRLPVIIVENPRLIVGELAAWFYGSPFRKMFCVGITGTNGKTTTASLLDQIWKMNGRETGFVGTTGIQISNEEMPASFTTPEATELQAIAASMVEKHISHMVMEVSSHALSQHRIAGGKFKTVAFTNLTQDHLDFHGDMESYFAAKSKLFTSEFADVGFINVDDPYGARLFESSQIPVVSVSRNNNKATWHYVKTEISRRGYEIAIRGSGGILIEGELPLVGAHNLDNALMAIALAVESGIDPLAISADLSKLRGPAGRLEKVDLGQNFLALVDYAHTPDAVERVLQALREISTGRVIAVLGCGGDRDATKRPLMGNALVSGSDVAIMTSDNPRSENPEDILKQMQGDHELGTSVIAEVDRRGAIAIAVAEASAGDVIVLLGKGHENGQEIHGVKKPFDDRVELARAIERLS
jgi:UDP-N-acetylmuramoyl-L-alanyl-D-glutamate--2,6-diaminopimelate ligase